jgi:RHS repeat-associated protein
MAKVNPFRFSTKFQDDETDLLYYGYRYYSASTGRWLSRDPKDELGGLNIYGFLRNGPISDFDRLGLSGSDGGGCTCGPEISYQVKSVLLNAQMTFTRTWPENAKLHACTALVDFMNPASMKAWEIEPLYTWGTVDLKVVFNKKCYYASAVNYALWGTACRLCYDAAILYNWHDDTGAFLAPMWTHKRALFWARFWKHTLLKDYSDRADEAFSFTTYGYNGRLDHGGIAGLTWDGRYQRTPFDWSWSPNNETDGGY